MPTSSSPSASAGIAVVTGASSGIGACYADRLARRGHDLVLVARDRERLETLARRLAAETGRVVETLPADLTDKADLARIEYRLGTDPGITMLVNNAGVAATTALLDSDVEQMAQMIALNVTAPTRLTHAISPGLAARGRGTIINIASIVGIAPELLNGVYGASKAYVLAFSLSLHKELAGRGVRIQAVLPGATATELWRRAGRPVEQLPPDIVMSTDDMVDAALAGLDQGELVTIPSLPDAADWLAYEAARQKLMPNLSRRQPADRYRTAPAAA